MAGAHRRMRRADREVTDPQEIRRIIDAAHVINVAYRDDEGLTVVPVDFGYEWHEPLGNGADAGACGTPSGLVFYMHSSPIGRKADALRAAGPIGLEVSFDLIADGSETIPGRTLCSWGRAYASLVGTGTAFIVSDAQEAARGMSLLMAHEAGMVDESGAPTASFTQQQVRSVMVWRIEVDAFAAKSRPMPSAAHALSPAANGE